MNGNNYLILIVEDDEEMAQLNARLLKRCGYEAFAVYNAADALALANGNGDGNGKKKEFDLFVLDIELPDGDGVALCSELRRDTDAPVLFLTGRAETEDKIAALSTGGDYYLTKPYDRNEFVAVVNSLLRRAAQTKKKISELSVIERGPFILKIYENKAFVNGRDAELTQKEFAVLLMLIKNENKEVPNEALYESVWNAPMNNNSGALRVHVSNLKKKIGEENSNDFAIFNNHGVGYTLTMYR